MSDYRVGFRDLTEEVTDRDLAVEGELPDWLDGSLVRNGPARWTVDGAEADHWFDGLAHLTRFRVVDGGVRYTNRFLRTEAYRHAVEEGEFVGQFSSSGSYLQRLRSMLSGTATDNANVHVARLAGDLVALTETPNWLRVDAESLAVRGPLDYDDDLTAHHVTAHLRHDADAGETWGYCTRFGPTSEYVLFRMADGSARREAVARVDVDRPAYMHSFALTRDHAVLVEPPLVTHVARFLSPTLDGFIDAYDWRPERGTRFLVFDREDGSLAAEATLPAFFTFHTANAFDAPATVADGESVVVDLVAYDDASAVTDLSMEALHGGDGGFPSGELRRYRLPLDGGGPSAESLAADVEMPRFSPAVHMEPYRYVFAQSTEMDDGNALVRVDVTTGETVRWEESGLFTGEPVFVPRPQGGDDGAEEGGDDDTTESDGVVFSLCLDADAERSVLLVLDGGLTELARAPLPHAVPFGFHGEFFPD